MAAAAVVQNVMIVNSCDSGSLAQENARGRKSFDASRLGRRVSDRKPFFFEKKKQKTFANLAAVSPERLGSNEQKFFGSFFQKRTSSFTLGGILFVVLSIAAV
jgi:hypothetical protein